MADAAEKKDAKKRRPSALKRDLQNARRRLRNRSQKSEVVTAIRDITESLSKKESPEQTNKKLGELFSLMDKGVKKGVFKANKAARTKSRLAARVKA